MEEEEEESSFEEFYFEFAEETLSTEESDSFLEMSDKS
jgi:hypothetical protein